MESTVSTTLEKLRALKDRKKQLEELLKETSTETAWRDMSQKQKSPLYDVVKVDEKITKINNAIFEISAAIKQSNAVTQISVDVDFADLMSPIARG
jgi:hypothetical protein